MQKPNILELLYKKSPMDFYTYTDNNETIIKSVKNISTGYKFDKKFSKKEIAQTWNSIKFHKRTSTILIFLIIIAIMYGAIFPNFTFFIDNPWFINLIIILIITLGTFSIVSRLSNIHFELWLEKKYGKFSKTKFISSNKINPDFYHLFTAELCKVGIIILCIILFISVGSPLKVAQNYIYKNKYTDTIKITSVGAIIFPIIPEWYSLRGFAKFQLKDYKGAIKDFEKAYMLEADEYNTTNFDNKIYIKYYNNDYQSALKDFDSEIKNAENDYKKDIFMWDKAQFLYNIKKYNEALELYTELLSKADSDSTFLLKDRLYLERGQVYQILGKNDLAVEDIINSGSFELIDEKIDSIPKPNLILEDI